jgi:uncharacterized delta-60 repeat protein
MSPASVLSRFRSGIRIRKPVFPRSGARISVLGAAILGASLLAPMPAMQAQAPGTQDKSFLAAAIGGTVYALSVQTIDEQKVILVGGDAGLLGRLNLTDGSVNDTFTDAAFGDANRIIYAGAEQIIPTAPDQDKSLIGGLFGKTKVANSGGKLLPAQNVTRLNSGGDIDPTFNAGGQGANGYVTCILPEANGSIVIGGLFDHYNKKTRNHIARLNIDGTLDTTFSSALTINDSVLSLADQLDPATGLPNGQILAVGLFNGVDKTSTTKIARINSDGSLDTSFNPSIDTRVLAVAVQPDGKIIIGGDFQLINGQAVNNIARLNFDGSLDTTFTATITGNPAGSPTTTAVYVLTLLPDGRFYAGGNFDTADGVTRNYLARFEPDGALDTVFDPGTAVINSVESLAIQPDNKVLVGETVSRKINNIFPASLIRLYGDPVVTPPVAAAPPTITIRANKPDAVEAGPVDGQFKLVRQGADLSGSTTVYLKLGGTAVSGQDYEPLKLDAYKEKTYTVTFGPGETSIKITVKPTGDTLAASPETVILRLKPDGAGGVTYIPTGKTKATVTLSNN